MEIAQNIAGPIIAFVQVWNVLGTAARDANELKRYLRPYRDPFKTGAMVLWKQDADSIVYNGVSILELQKIAFRAHNTGIQYSERLCLMKVDPDIAVLFQRELIAVSVCEMRKLVHCILLAFVFIV